MTTVIGRLTYNHRMPTETEEFLLQLLRACADCAPAPLYPAQFARERNLDREQLDVGLDELRRRGLLKLTDWVKDLGQGRALTDAGEQALKTRRLTPASASAPTAANAAADETGAYGRGELVRRSVFDPATAWVTRGLLIANIAYFLFGALYAGWHGLDVGDYLAGNAHSTRLVLIELGALHPGLVFQQSRDPDEPDPRPHYERIILFTFLHIGLFHLFMNMYFLGTLGRQIESMWGSVRYLIIYAIAGVASGCLVLLLAPLQEAPAPVAGASGCLYGIFASMVVWFVLNRGHLPQNLIQAWSRNLGINLVLLIGINFIEGISWQGHLGGAVGGLLAALLLHVQRFHPVRAMRILALLGVPLVPIAFFVAVLWQAGRL
jgi:membrane associated rhomboid family serine protease